MRTELPVIQPAVAPEVPLDFTREWIEFQIPADAAHWIRADLTWLCSRWTCIFGRGCQGVIEKDGPTTAAAAHGAFFSDDDDEQRVKEFAAELTPETWQYARRGTEEEREAGDLREDSVGDDEDRRRTRSVDGACIFLNRPGFAGGEGCSLHALALREGLHPLDTKPEVCWQLPVRRSQEWVDRPDETRILLSTVTEFDRRGWGEGGHDLHWYCTSSPDAHVGGEPLYVSYAAGTHRVDRGRPIEELAQLCRRLARPGRRTSGHRRGAEQGPQGQPCTLAVAGAGRLRPRTCSRVRAR